jgi:peptidoglycan-associated lipoprotein
MIKKIFSICAFFILFSCASLKKSEEINLTQPTSENQAGEQYQTVENQQQANEINQEQQQEIEVQDRVLFSYDSSEISDDAKKILDVQITWLKSDLSIAINIEGHCDERGTREYNIALGEKRAVAVKKYLVAGGINSSRIKTVSYGKERPAFVGTDEEALSKNRRAVVVPNNS